MVDLQQYMSGSIRNIMTKAYKNVLKNPRQAKFAFKMQRVFEKSEKRRKKIEEAEGLNVLALQRQQRGPDRSAPGLAVAPVPHNSRRPRPRMGAHWRMHPLRASRRDREDDGLTHPLAGLRHKQGCRFIKTTAGRPRDALLSYKGF